MKLKNYIKTIIFSEWIPKMMVLEHVSPLKICLLWISMLNFWGQEGHLSTKTAKAQASGSHGVAAVHFLQRSKVFFQWVDEKVMAGSFVSFGSVCSLKGILRTYSIDSNEEVGENHQLQKVTLF